MNLFMNLFDSPSLNMSIVTLIGILVFIFAGFGCYKTGLYRTGFLLSVLSVLIMSGILIFYLLGQDIPSRINKNKFHSVIQKINNPVDKNLVQTWYKINKDKYVLSNSIQKQDKKYIKRIFQSIQYNKKYSVPMIIVNSYIKTTVNVIVLFCVSVIFIGSMIIRLFRKPYASRKVAVFIITSVLLLLFGIVYSILSTDFFFSTIIWPFAVIFLLFVIGYWFYRKEQYLAALFLLSFTSVLIFIYLFLLMDIKYPLVILISYLAGFWFFRLRQYLLALFTFILMIFFFTDNPSNSENKISLNSMACEIPGNYFNNVIINKIEKREDRDIIKSLYCNAGSDLFTLNTPVLNQIQDSIEIDHFYNDILLQIPGIDDRKSIQKYYVLDVEHFAEIKSGLFESDILKKITDKEDRKLVIDSYKQDNRKYILKKSLDENDKNKVALILNSIGYKQQYKLRSSINYYPDPCLYHYRIPEIFRLLQYKRSRYYSILEQYGIINPALKVVVWVPNKMEPENKKEITLVAQFNSIDQPAYYRISVDYNENILTCSAIPDKNILKNDKQSDEYSSSVLFEGEIRSNEIISKKIMLEVLSHTWKEARITFRLEKEVRNSNIAEDVSDPVPGEGKEHDRVWNLEDLYVHKIKEEYRLTSYVPIISLFIGVIGSLIAFLFQLIEAFRRKEKEYK